jgi:hypothetical protein
MVLFSNLYVSNNYLNLNKMVRAAFLRLKTIYSWHRGVQNLFLIRHPLLCIGRLIKAKYTKGFVRGLVVLIYRIENLRKKQGLRGVCLYLKACSILVIKFATSDPSPRNSVTYGPHVSLTNKGIPRILPIILRKEVSSRN